MKTVIYRTRGFEDYIEEAEVLAELEYDGATVYIVDKDNGLYPVYTGMLVTEEELSRYKELLSLEKERAVLTNKIDKLREENYERARSSK